MGRLQQEMTFWVMEVILSPNRAKAIKLSICFNSLITEMATFKDSQISRCEKIFSKMYYLWKWRGYILNVSFDCHTILSFLLFVFISINFLIFISVRIYTHANKNKCTHNSTEQGSTCLHRFLDLLITNHLQEKKLDLSWPHRSHLRD